MPIKSNKNNSPRNPAKIHEALSKFYIKDKEELDKKINDILNMKVGDLIRLSFRYSLPSKMIGIVKEVNQKSITLYTNLSNEFYINKNVILSALKDEMATNINIEVLNKSHL